MKTDWIKTGKGTFAHPFINGLFAQACKNGKYIVFMATPTFGRRLWSELVTSDEFINYSLK